MNDSIRYSVSFPQAHNHYVHISIQKQVTAGETVCFKMAAWTPGSYMIRNYAQHVITLNAHVNGTPVTCERLDTNTWSIGDVVTGMLIIDYMVYANEYGVRSSYVDGFMAFLHGASVFGYLEAELETPISIALDLGSLPWKDIKSPMPQTQPNTFIAANYDELVDSPIALGNFTCIEFETYNVPHEIVLIGEGSYDVDQLKADFKLICDEATEVCKHHPSPRFIHFIQNCDAGGGGLEHKNCQTSQVIRWHYKDEAKYRTFLGLVAHEYFHLWNVKRIRPLELGPFDYTKENYTDMLWVAEGITSYFDDIILRRCGLHTNKTYLEELAGNINRFENMPGKAFMSLDESSKLAWIKAYMRNEDSNNTTVSYYNKGMLVAWLLDIRLMELTDGAKRLDDVMRLLYNRYYMNGDVGFDHQAFYDACAEVAGTSLETFLHKYIFTTEPFEYDFALRYLGLEMKDESGNDPEIGVKLKRVDGKVKIIYVHPNGGALEAGLSVNDEIIAINHWRVDEENYGKFEGFETGKTAHILYARNGIVKETQVPVKSKFEAKYVLKPLDEPSNLQEQNLKRWLSA